MDMGRLPVSLLLLRLRFRRWLKALSCSGTVPCKNSTHVVEAMVEVQCRLSVLYVHMCVCICCTSAMSAVALLYLAKQPDKPHVGKSQAEDRL